MSEQVIVTLPSGNTARLPASLSSEEMDRQMGALIDFDQRGVGLTFPPSWQSNSPSPPPSPQSIDFKKMLKQTVLPVLGGWAGGTLGAVGGPAGAVAGMAAGSGLGELANQRLGVSDPSLLQLGMATGLPLLSPALRAVLVNSPGAEAGLQQLAVNLARKTAMPFSTSAGPVYEQALKAGTKLPVGPIQDAIARVVGAEAKLAPEFRVPQVQKALAGLERVVTLDYAPVIVKEIALNVLHPNLQRLGARYGAALRANTESANFARGPLTELYQGIQAAIDVAARSAKGEGAELLREANSLFKRNLAHEELTDLVTRSTRSTAGHWGIEGDKLRDAIKEGSKSRENLSRWISPEELQDIDKTFKAIAAVAPIPLGGKMGVGSMQFPARALVGGGLGAALGGPIGMAGGVVATEALTRAMMSTSGRALVRVLASSKLGGQGQTMDQIMNTLIQTMRTEPGESLKLAASGGHTFSDVLRQGYDLTQSYPAAIRPQFER